MPKHKPHNALRQKMPDFNDPHAVRRFVALCFKFYERCENRHCRRASQCVGADAPCFDAFWWQLPEICKNIYREMVKARLAGAKTKEEIENIAFAKIMAHYTPEQICEAAAQVKNGRAKPADRRLCATRTSG